MYAYMYVSMYVYNGLQSSHDCPALPSQVWTLQGSATGRTQKLPFQACAIKSDAWDWLNDEEAVLPGDHVQTPAPTWWLSATCNSSPQGSSGLLWPSKGTSCIWCTHVHAGKIATHIKNKINKILFMRKISRVKLYPPLS